MLQSLRENIKGVTAFILVGILIIPFAFFGVESLFVSGTSVEQVATVNGEKITRLELDRGLEFQRQRILSQVEDMDPALLDDERLRGPVLDQLIRQKLLVLTAADHGIEVSDKSFNEMILGNEAFREGGSFSEDLYRYQLSRLGYTPITYRKTVKEELAASHVRAGIQATAFNTEAQLSDFGQLAMQERSFRYVVLSQEGAPGIDVDKAEIEAYYEENREQLREPEKVVVEYIELTPALLAEQAEPDPEMLEERLADARAAAETEGKTWRLAHILVDPDAEEGETAATIEQRLAAGEAFSELAREYSADFGSADAGGELGTFTADALPPGFADAIEGLEEGEVTGPVELESGTHFIRLLDISEGGGSAAAVSREQMERELRNELAQEQMPAVLEKLKEETFSVDALEPVGELLSLPVKVSEAFARSGGEGIARYPAVVEAAFSEDVLEEGFASRVLELESNHHVVIKLKELIPSHVPPLDQVADEIEEILSIRKAQAAVKQRGEAILASVDAGESLENAAGEAGLSVESRSGVTRFDQRLPEALGRAVFEPPESVDLPVTGMATIRNGDVAVFVLSEITPGSVAALSAEERRSLGRSLARLDGDREFGAFLDTLENHAKIKRKLPSAGE